MKNTLKQDQTYFTVHKDGDIRKHAYSGPDIDRVGLHSIIKGYDKTLSFTYFGSEGSYIGGSDRRDDVIRAAWEREFEAGTRNWTDTHPISQATINDVLERPFR